MLIFRVSYIPLKIEIMNILLSPFILTIVITHSEGKKNKNKKGHGT
jgi:hypothetical protein